jgi:mannose-6-phosphate isomerase-like protein (cupin superfamily)
MDNGTLSGSTYDAFRAHPLMRGADEVLERHWAPDQVVETHSHPFDADAVVTAGEMWLMREDSTQHLRVGDTFPLGAGTPHSERYGPKGATYWVARRHRAEATAAAVAGPAEQ